MRIIENYSFITLKEKPELQTEASAWFHSKWDIPEEEYFSCMGDYLTGKTENGWYLCLDGVRIIAGLGVIDNDFHDRKDLKPNVCAVYTDEDYRCQGIAGTLLNMVVEDMKLKGITPIYLVTDHTGFYERYGWKFLGMVHCENDNKQGRMYIHY